MKQPFPNLGRTQGTHTDTDRRGFINAQAIEVLPVTGSNVQIISIEQDIDYWMVTLHVGAGAVEIGVYPWEIAPFAHSNLLAPNLRPPFIFGNNLNRAQVPIPIPRNTYTFSVVNLSGAGNAARGSLAYWRMGG